MACGRFGVDLVGGDTSASVTGLVISVTDDDQSDIVAKSDATIVAPLIFAYLLGW